MFTRLSQLPDSGPIRGPTKAHGRNELQCSRGIEWIYFGTVAAKLPNLFDCLNSRNTAGDTEGNAFIKKLGTLYIDAVIITFRRHNLKLSQLFEDFEAPLDFVELKLKQAVKAKILYRK